jgi:4,5-dihydroxyphthalate decarboxylase
VNRKWAETHGGVPINHMLVMRQSIVKSRPDVAREVFRMVLESRRQMDSSKDGKLDPLRFGLDNVRKSLELAIEMSLVQKFIARRLSVDELFDDTTRALAP